MRDQNFGDWKNLPDNIDLSGKTDKNGVAYTFGQGGYGLLESVYHISKLDNHMGSLTETVFPLPAWVSYMILLVKQRGMDSVRDDIKAILEIR